MKQNLFCEIYVDAADERDTFIEKIAAMLKGQRLNYEVIAEWATIDVLANNEYGETFEEPKDAFLGYRYKLEFEFEPEKQTSHHEYIGHVGELLSNLWDVGYKAVAACSFEDELPEKGGYGRLQ